MLALGFFVASCNVVLLTRLLVTQSSTLLQLDHAATKKAVAATLLDEFDDDAGGKDFINMFSSKYGVHEAPKYK